MRYPWEKGSRGCCRAGFAYISVLILLAVSGVALSETGRYWQSITRRSKETELMFRGHQIRAAIGSYYRSSAGQENTYPRRLSDLLKDPRFPTVRRHLRKLYRDPMTSGGDWGVVLANNGGIKGVFSKSTAVPLKQGGFQETYRSFADARQYSDWKFVYDPKASKSTGS